MPSKGAHGGVCTCVRRGQGGECSASRSVADVVLLQKVVRCGLPVDLADEN